MEQRNTLETCLKTLTTQKKIERVEGLREAINWYDKTGLLNNEQMDVVLEAARIQLKRQEG